MNVKLFDSAIVNNYREVANSKGAIQEMKVFSNNNLGGVTAGWRVSSRTYWMNPASRRLSIIIMTLPNASRLRQR